MAKLDDVAARIDEIIADRNTSRRVRTALDKVKAALVGDGEQDMDVKLTTAIYRLDEISNDVTVPMHAKTLLWDIISDLEAIRGGK